MRRRRVGCVPAARVQSQRGRARRSASGGVGSCGARRAQRQRAAVLGTSCGRARHHVAAQGARARSAGALGCGLLRSLESSLRLRRPPRFACPKEMVSRALVTCRLCTSVRPAAQNGDRFACYAARPFSIFSGREGRKSKQRHRSRLPPRESAPRRLVPGDVRLESVSPRPAPSPSLLSTR